MPAKLDDRRELAAVQSAISGKTKEVRGLEQARDEAADVFRAAGITPEGMHQAPEYVALRDADEACQAASAALTEMKGVERTLLSAMSPSDIRHIDASGGSRRDEWTVEGFAASEGAKLAGEYATSKAKFGSITLFSASPDSQEQREDTVRLLASGQGDGRYLAAPVGSGDVDGAIPADRRGFIAPMLRQLRLTDLLPTGTTGSNSVDYVQVQTAPGQAVEVAENAAKPEANFVTVDATAPVRTIAEWKKLSRQSIADAAGLLTFIQQLISFDVRRRLDAQLIAGDGAGQNIRGLLNTTGIGVPAFVAGDDALMATQRAITATWLAEGQPTFVAVNPSVMQAIRFIKDTTGRYVYGSPATPDPNPRIWGLPAIVTTAMPTTHVLVGDSTQATLLVREGLTVRLSDSDADDFVSNRVTVLVETRAAFPVWRPGAFAKGALA